MKVGIVINLQTIDWLTHRHGKCWTATLPPTAIGCAARSNRPSPSLGSCRSSGYSPARPKLRRQQGPPPTSRRWKARLATRTSSNTPSSGRGERVPSARTSPRPKGNAASISASPTRPRLGRLFLGRRGGGRRGRSGAKSPLPPNEFGGAVGTRGDGGVAQVYGEMWPSAKPVAAVHSPAG